jgi:hypothetical protein
LNECNNLQRYLKKDYENELKIDSSGYTQHDACINHCMLYAFGACSQLHTKICDHCGSFFRLFKQVQEHIPSDSYTELEELQGYLLYYLAHQTRKVYLNVQFNAHLGEIDEKGAVIIVDYKMKILPKSARETKQDFFGKKGWTLHSALVYTRSQDGINLQVHAFDYWSNDTRQDSWFTASSLHAIMMELNPKPEWIIFISDNGPHYHNADLMMIMRRWKEWYNIDVRKWTFLEAGEAKTSIDSHHAQVKIIF